MKKYLKNVLTSPPVRNMRVLTHEVTIALYIKEDNTVSYRNHYSKEGTGDNAEIPSIEEIIDGCKRLKTKEVILVHNHPTQKAEPSENDIIATNFLIQKLRQVGITLVDHVIVANNNHYSFAEDSDNY